MLLGLSYDHVDLLVPMHRYQYVVIQLPHFHSPWGLMNTSNRPYIHPLSLTVRLVRLSIIVTDVMPRNPFDSIVSKCLDFYAQCRHHYMVHHIILCQMSPRSLYPCLIWHPRWESIVHHNW